jgi:hypothetical protein
VWPGGFRRTDEIRNAAQREILTLALRSCGNALIALGTHGKHLSFFLDKRMMLL